MKQSNCVPLFLKLIQILSRKKKAKKMFSFLQQKVRASGCPNADCVHPATALAASLETDSELPQCCSAGK